MTWWVTGVVSKTTSPATSATTARRRRQPGPAPAGRSLPLRARRATPAAAASSPTPADQQDQSDHPGQHREHQRRSQQGPHPERDQRYPYADAGPTGRPGAWVTAAHTWRAADRQVDLGDDGAGRRRHKPPRCGGDRRRPP